MSVEIIDRTKSPHEKKTINAYGEKRPQISYNSEGRITIRIMHGNAEDDTLIVFDRPLSVSLIYFIKNGIVELPTSQQYCKNCADVITGKLPF